jgi:pyrroline-5-carboxylate reductase
MMKVLACKPQNVMDIGETITATPKGVIMSVVAGMPVDKLQTAFKTKMVVRCMPNTPASVGEGMTVWYASKEVPEHIEQLAKDILRCAGASSHV